MCLHNLYVADTSNLLDQVVAELEQRKGDLPALAKASGMSYDTILRIKNREGDPGYSKVEKLHRFLFPTSADTDA